MSWSGWTTRRTSCGTTWLQGRGLWPLLKAETERLVELLDAGEYESPDELAKALYAECVQMYLSHPMWGVSVPGYGAVGPFETKARAKSWAKAYWHLPDTHVRSLHPFATAVPAEDTPVTQYCDTCTHPKFAHFPSKGGCLVDNCDCKENYK